MALDSSLQIYCPACRWEPTSSSQWACRCGCLWNTFDTAGVCPQCHYRWHHTQCLACEVISLHIDWYHGLSEEVAQLVEEALFVPAAVCCTVHES